MYTTNAAGKQQNLQRLPTSLTQTENVQKWHWLHLTCRLQEQGTTREIVSHPHLQLKVGLLAENQRRQSSKHGRPGRLGHNSAIPAAFYWCAHGRLEAHAVKRPSAPWANFRRIADVMRRRRLCSGIRCLSELKHAGCGPTVIHTMLI